MAQIFTSIKDSKKPGAKRPRLVTAVAVLLFIAAFMIAIVVAAVSFLQIMVSSSAKAGANGANPAISSFSSGINTFLHQSFGLMVSVNEVVIFVSIILAAFAALYIAMGVGLLKLVPWSRRFTIILALISTISGIISISNGAVTVGNFIVEFISAAITFYLYFSPRVRYAFGVTKKMLPVDLYSLLVFSIILVLSMIGSTLLGNTGHYSSIRNTSNPASLIQTGNSLLDSTQPKGNPSAPANGSD